MKYKIIILVLVLLAGGVVVATLFSLNKNNALTLPAPEPVVEFPATPSNTIYTMDEVALHKDASSCWTAIRGQVYDLTSWIAQHPGGEKAILNLCGIDGTEAFNSQHQGQKNPEARLAGLEIGNLK